MIIAVNNVTGRLRLDEEIANIDELFTHETFEVIGISRLDYDG